MGRELPLLGGGPDTYQLRSRLVFTRELPGGQVRRTSVDAAHCEYLNLWVNTGLPSMLLFLGLLASVLLPAARRLDAGILPLLLPALGYAIHALFGISQSLVSPLFYFFLGALARASRSNKITHLPRSGRIGLTGVIFMRKRDSVICFCAVALAVVLLLYARPPGRWRPAPGGSASRPRGRRRVGSASQEALAQYDAAYLGDTGQPVLYLTFDAGYENGCTAQILDVLKDHQVPAAFFLVGNYLERNPELVKRMVEEGHTVGNHTAHHYDMSKIGDKATFSQELKEVEDLYRDVTGQELPRYYRPPQGIYSQENLAMAQELGYKTVFWSLAYVDWNNDSQPTREEAFSKLIPRIHNGAVVLLHSTSKTNAAILDELLTKWEEMGYRFESVESLFA